MNLGHLNCLNTIHFSILHCYPASNNNCTYKDCETATLRDFFVMSDLSSAKQPSKKAPRMPQWSCDFLHAFLKCS